MNNLSLIAFGFGWMVVAAVLGLYLGARQEGHLGHLDKAAARGDLAAYHRTFEAYKWRSTVHAHGMLFALSSVAVGAVLPQAGLGKAQMEYLVAGLMMATVVWMVAALRRIRPVMGVADLVFAGSLATVAWCIAANH